MRPNDISGLVKALMALVLFSIAIGQYPRLRKFALTEGIKALMLVDYKPVYFFGSAK